MNALMKKPAPSQIREPILPPHRYSWGDEDQKTKKKKGLSPLFLLYSGIALMASGIGIYIALNQPKDALPGKNAMDVCLDSKVTEMLDRRNLPVNTRTDINKQAFGNLFVECASRYPNMPAKWYEAKAPDLFKANLPNRSLHVRVHGKGNYEVVGSALPIPEPVPIKPEEWPSVIVRTIPLCDVKPELCGNPKP